MLLLALSHRHRSRRTLANTCQLCVRSIPCTDKEECCISNLNIKGRSALRFWLGGVKAEGVSAAAATCWNTHVDDTLEMLCLKKDRVSKFLFTVNGECCGKNIKKTPQRFVISPRRKNQAFKCRTLMWEEGSESVVMEKVPWKQCENCLNTTAKTSQDKELLIVLCHSNNQNQVIFILLIININIWFQFMHLKAALCSSLP